MAGTNQVTVQVRTREASGKLRSRESDGPPRPEHARFETTRTGQDHNPLVRVVPPRGEPFYALARDLEQAVEAVRRGR